ncbi:hypothetical protein [Actinomyces vulturis]|uniref:hypothetical protein n=1 Tax=Actinomyces vulturis TaxID=1857645 RepID=UPI0008315544|nr:hypothetical protein [Actinomyces vulturis]
MAADIYERNQRLYSARLALTHAEEKAGLQQAHQREISDFFQEKNFSFESIIFTWAHDGGVIQISHSTTVMLTCAGILQREGQWCIIAGWPEINLDAAAECGIDLHRTLVVGEGEGVSPLSMINTCIDGAAIVILGPGLGAILQPCQQRSLVAKARQRHSIVFTSDKWVSARRCTAHLESLADGLIKERPIDGLAEGVFIDFLENDCLGKKVFADGVLEEAPINSLQEENFADGVEKSCLVSRAFAMPAQSGSIMPYGYIRQLTWNVDFLSPHRPAAACIHGEQWAEGALSKRPYPGKSSRFEEQRLHLPSRGGESAPHAGGVEGLRGVPRGAKHISSVGYGIDTERHLAAVDTDIPLKAVG